ncbi:MAG TPA: hypothetical protein VFQ61_07705 [Polyangiaceae bacterium]|nr:hypothetical protein [Polyangiaceae bacterium]
MKLRVADLREIVRAVVADALATHAQHDLLDLKQVFERYRVGRDALVAAAKRGEVELSQGPRRKFLIRARELEQWLTRRKYVPPALATAKDLQEWDRQADLALERALVQGRLRQLSPPELEEARARRSRKKRP